MTRSLLTTLMVFVAAGALAGEKGRKFRWTPPYKDDPAVIAKLKALGEGEAARLPIKVEGLEGGYAKNSWLKNGPFTRGYCTKMPYAADRQTAFYCGQDHNLPHYNDAWEFHLGSSTWHCLSNPDGGDTANAWRRWPGRLKKEKDPAKRKELEEKIRAWMKANVKFENGYLQTKKNDGPVMAWHTWDGLGYDPRVGKMFWIVLDDQKTNQHYLKTWCKWTGKDYETEKKKLKPGTGMWSFDPGTKKWARWLGKQPHARMRGMGGSLTYIPDKKKFIWYCAAFNVSPPDCQMWTYDTVTNKWRNLKPKCDWGRKESPKSEAQMAYSPKHGKMVAVVGKSTFVYDLAANAWSKAASEKDQFASDFTTVFAYDSNADLFLLTNAPKGQWDKTRDLRAFDLETRKWKKLTVKGAPVARGMGKGYYDPEHNVFVVADKGPVWVYRHKRSAPKKTASSPAPVRTLRSTPKKTATFAPSFRTPSSAVRTPKQVCTGWFSSARNYKKIGMLADARRCLNNIVKAYPKTEWATRARQELNSL